MEEQVIAFGLGVLVVLTVVGVINMFKSTRKLNTMRDELNGCLLDIVDLESKINSRLEHLDERIDNEIDRLHDIEDKLYKYIDSRTDKIESRCDNKFNDNTAFVDGLYNTIADIKQKIKLKLK
ncbi:hypothetical protein OAB94_00930 [Flavobacteriaceae bacterium]|nr:hypothetical protein [Flavobacteriaceae bacterium]